MATLPEQLQNLQAQYSATYSLLEAVSCSINKLVSYNPGSAEVEFLLNWCSKFNSDLLFIKNELEAKYREFDQLRDQIYQQTLVEDSSKKE